MEGYFDILSWSGEVKVVFGQVYKYKSNFDRQKTWLVKALELLEHFLLERGIKVSREDLYFRLNIKRIKGEDVETILKNLEKSLIKVDTQPSLYDCLTEIFEDKTKISKVERFSVKKWLSKVPPEKILEILTYFIGVLLFLITGRFLQFM